MESNTRLDHVLFQLTPTRTRCELVIFAGKVNEKLAYGLLEPFVTHLRSAKDQISRGGYSITLRPPSADNAHWFTKGTVLRFVRFVSTPEVLERFVTIEREISQLENSIKSYEASNAADDDSEGNGTNSGVSSKSKGETNGSSDLTQEENSKARLQRVVETRKAVLRKEQAMVYARALAAGYEINNLHELILFSDSFGASRLREACINFTDLCKKKNEDRLWVDEITAMQAMVQPELAFMGSSGIILAGEENDPSMLAGKQNGSTDMSLSDSLTSHGSLDANQDSQTPQIDVKAQMQNPWAQQFPPYLRNFQGPIYQQMPPYQGYGFPGMQVAPPYYPANMSWPSDFNGSTDHESHDLRDRKSSSRKKGKASKARGSEKEDHDEYTESSGSGSATDSSSERSHRKKHGRKGSRKVVIRNINYITSKRDEEKDGSSETDSSDKDDYLNGDSLKQQLEDAVGSFEKHTKSTSRHHKKRSGSKHLSSVNGSADQDNEDISLKNRNGNKNENWDALQQLLMREESESNNTLSHSVSVEEKYFATERSHEQNSTAFKPEAEERAKNKPIANDAFLVTEKGVGNDSDAGKISGQGFDPSESTLPVLRRDSAPEEVLFLHRSEEPQNYTRVPLSDDVVHSSVIRSQTSDDWFVGKQSDEAVNRGGNNHLRFIEGDYVRSSICQDERKNKDVIIDDSLMIQGRLTDDHHETQLKTDISLVSDIIEANLFENGTAVPHQKTESPSFYEPDALYMVRDHDAVVEHTIPSWSPELDYENYMAVNDHAKKADEDAYAESNLTTNEKVADNKKSGKASSKDPRSRTLGGSLRKAKPETTPGARRSTFGSKTTTPKTQLEKDEERRKRMEELVIRRQKRIAERSSGTGNNHVTSRKPQTGSKADSATLDSDKSKPKPVLRSSTIERLAAAKTSPKAPSAQPKNEAPKVKGKNVNSGSQKPASTDTKKVNADKNKPSEKKPVDENIEGVCSTALDDKEGTVTNKTGTPTPTMELSTMQGVNVFHEVEDPKDIKELHVTSSTINKDVKVVAQINTSVEKVGNLLEDQPTNLDYVKKNNDILSKESLSFPKEEKVSDDHNKSGPELSIHPLPESPPKHVGSALIDDEERATKTRNSPKFTEISEIEESTPPPTKEMSVDPIQTRKKWDGAENSPKSAKGFRKLLMFARKKD